MCFPGDPENNPIPKILLITTICLKHIFDQRLYSKTLRNDPWNLLSNNLHIQVTILRAL